MRGFFDLVLLLAIVDQNVRFYYDLGAAEQEDARNVKAYGGDVGRPKPR